MVEADKKRRLPKSLTQKVKFFFKKRIADCDFFQNKVVRWLLFLNFIANFINWVFLFLFISKIDVGIILHYNVYFGVDSIGDWRNALAMPFIGLFLFILNSILAAYFYKNKERIACHILLLVSFMTQIGFIIASASVVMINY